jgi:O-6-methylguanine DNA methyltransferase
MKINERETSQITDDPELVALIADLRATASPMLIDPIFRAALRAELLGEAQPLCYAALLSPFGRIWVAFQGHHVRIISGRNEADFLAEAQRTLDVLPIRSDTIPEKLARRVLTAIAGRRQVVAEAELAQLTPFQRAVLAQTQRIPRGEVRSYAWIAREVGQPRAVRAVGSALANNPLPLLIPCHRVIRSDGTLGQYSGGGTLHKAEILTYEGVNLQQLQTLAHAGLRFQGCRTTKIFCLPTCYSGKHMQDHNRVYFHSEAEARQQGFRPCKLCRPAL